MIRLARTFALGAVLLSLIGCGGSTAAGGTGAASPSPSIPAGAVVIKVVANADTVGAFDPKNATAKVGQVVAWVFEDPGNEHTVTADDGSFDSSTQSQGYVFTHTFTKPGTYAYHCSLHSDMTGQVTVTQ